MRYTREDGCAAWLASAAVPPDIMAELYRTYGSAEAVYEAFKAGREDFGSLTPACRRTLKTHSDERYIHQMLVTMQETDTDILTANDSRYPALLYDIQDPPQILFYIGDPACLKNRTVSMVGSRKASVQGLEAAQTVARELALAGVTVVSGLAMGIDAACHRGCIEGGMPTVAVIGCGTDVPYPVANTELRKKILDTGGILLSEYPPGSRPEAWHFPIRNRIISGLSPVTVMMEAQIRSGSMTTVRHALDQGREVYAYPGVAGTVWAEGAHQLLREGANYFTRAQDILEDMEWDLRQKTAEPEEIMPLEGAQAKILAALAGGDRGFDELLSETGLEAPELSAHLTMLQVMDLVHSLPGKLYHKVSHP